MGWQDDPIAAAPAATSAAPWERDPLVQQGPKNFGIDWSRPIQDVRAEVAKLPEADRQEALKQWATAYVAKEREGVKAMDLVPGAPGVGPNPKRIDDFVRTFSKGTIVGSFAESGNAEDWVLTYLATNGDKLARARAAYVRNADGSTQARIYASRGGGANNR